MSKFLYPIYKLKTKSYIKWWLYHKKAGGSGVLSEILEGFSFNLENTLNRKFKLFEIEGNSTQKTNLFDGKLSQGTLDNTGVEVDSAYRIRTTNYIEVVGGTTIPIKAQSNKEIQYLVFVFNNSKEVIETMGWNDINTSQTLQLNAKYIKLLFSYKDRSAISTSNVTNVVVGDVPNPNYEQPIKSAGDNGSINEKIKNADETEEQNYSIFVQQPMRSIGDVRDCFVKKSDGWYERHLPYIASYNGETLPQDVYNEVDNVKYCNEKSMSTTGQFSIGASVQYIDENNWNDLPCTETQIQQLENRPSTYKEMTIIQSEDETPAHLKIQYYKEG